MSNRNATASWSGFSHQGQVGILVALREMNKIAKEEYDSHFLEYETREDVAIYKQPLGGDKEYLSVHQVKAYYSAGNNTKVKYNEVLNGDFELCGNDFLHTVVSIEDWETSTTTNNNSVKRFKYSNNKYHCDTNEIESLIKEELKTSLGEDEGRIALALKRLTFELDSKIRTEHKKKYKPLFKVFFSMSRLNEVIKDNSDFDNSNIYNQRKTFYSLFINLVKIHDTEESHLQIINVDIIDVIYQLPDNDFVLFLQRLSLNESVDESGNHLLQFSQDGFRSVFFKLLLEITESLPILEEGSVKYSLTGRKEKFVLTTINEDEINAANVVRNILQNMKSQNLLWDNHELINREINKKLIDLIPNIKNVPTGIVDDGNKFMSFAKGNGLIDRETAKTILNHE